MFDCVGIAAKDISKAIHFYSLFNLDFKKFSDDHFEAETKNGTRLMLDSHRILKEMNPSWSASKHGNISLGFKMDSAVEVDSLVEKIIESNWIIVKLPYDAFWGQRYASVLDPDGNQIDIFSNL